MKLAQGARPAPARRAARSIVAALGLPLLLAGCNANLPDIQQWMDNVRSTTPPQRATLTEPKRFEPFYYEEVESIPPFSTSKLAALQDPMQVRAKGGLAPDTNRRREVLENFPLDQVQMVGFMRNSVSNTALFKIDQTIYQARVGNYAGQNYGVITKISETEVALRELVQDAAGEWVERETVLKLQESAK